MTLRAAAGEVMTLRAGEPLAGEIMSLLGIAYRRRGLLGSKVV